MADPQRILVLGCSGSGKSTLTQMLADRTGLPAIHLDQHFWGRGWIARDGNDFADRVAALISGERWIMEGNYTHSGHLDARVRRAQAAVLLDLPRWLCLLRVFVRLARWRGIVRPDMAPGCPEKVDWPFISYIWNWRRNSRPRILAALREFDGPVTILATPGAVRRFLAAPLPLPARSESVHV